jgi:para-aminobenzoate synthetase component 1
MKKINTRSTISRTPLIKEIHTPLSAVSAFGILPEGSRPVLLQGCPGHDAGRYSFIGIYPFLDLEYNSRGLTLRTRNGKKSISEDPLLTIDRITSSFTVDNPTDLPFVAGGIGCMSYDLKDIFETLPARSRDDMDLPLTVFSFYSALLIFDNADKGSVYISALDKEITGGRSAVSICDEIMGTLCSPLTGEPEIPAPGFGPVTANITPERYMEMVEKAIDYIRSGDIYQVCLSRRFHTESEIDGFDLYKKLNKASPSPFGAYLRTPSFSLISSSPELFLKRNGTHIETRPMKGTRPRSGLAEKDASLKKELHEDPKEDAELSMIVDLERNDLGKIAVPGSVRVNEHRRIEEHPNVFQTISVVEALLSPGTGHGDVIRAMFPGGSISGCPKIRAMQIIDELEPVRRSFYTGSIGYLSFHATACLNISIRTIIKKGTDIYYQTGSGITVGSDPEKELNESIHKARSFFECTGGRENGHYHG